MIKLEVQVLRNEELVRRLKKEQRKYAAYGRGAAVVGYTQRYAWKQHVDMTINHTVGKAKYLEDPAVEKRKKVLETVVRVFRRTGDFMIAVVTGGLIIQRASQEQVPVDTGALKNSAFTKWEPWR